jgi:hypothetical protein
MTINGVVDDDQLDNLIAQLKATSGSGAATATDGVAGDSA